jgi:hypothetical protein
MSGNCSSPLARPEGSRRGRTLLPRRPKMAKTRAPRAGNLGNVGLIAFEEPRAPTRQLRTAAGPYMEGAEE